MPLTRYGASDTLGRSQRDRINVCPSLPPFGELIRYTTAVTGFPPSSRRTFFFPPIRGDSEVTRGEKGKARLFLPFPLAGSGWLWPLFS